MKKISTSIRTGWTVAGIIGAVFLASSASAQTANPGKPEDNGVRAATDTTFVNTTDLINNTKSESIGVAIARNGNIVVGWEDDGDALNDLEAVWTIYGADGKLLTPETEQKSIDPDFAGQTITSHFLSYFRADKSPIPGRTAWGPKIKASLFSDAVGMGATAFDLGKEVAEFAPVMNSGSGGDWPAVQLFTGNGEPISSFSGVTEAYAGASGSIRIGDWDFLSTSNVVVVGESRQKQDLVDIYKGDSAQTHVIARIVDLKGKEVKPIQLVSATPTLAEMWHGVGVTKGGFGVRFASGGRATVRLFDNAGTPLTTNLDLGTLATNAVAAGGGRGDGAGFHGNGNDTYAAVATGTDANGNKIVWVTVLNTNGTVRWARSVSDDLTLAGPGACDVGVDSLGRVVVVYDDPMATGGNSRSILARVFDPKGTPLGKTFVVSEKDALDSSTPESKNPRVSFRNDNIVVAWLSKNSGAEGVNVVAFRSFVIPVKPGSIESAGLTRIVPDRPVINQGLDALGNWEPYASVLGTSTFLIEANAFAENSTDSQRFVVAFQPAAGGAAKQGEVFFTDKGVPFKGIVNASRQNGNPGRVAGDTRPGAVNFITGGEASPHLYTEFASDKRWTLGFDRLSDGRYATVQTFKLDPATLAQASLSVAQDSANGRLTSGAAPGNQISRYGGELIGLDNGNFVSVVEDRSKVRNPDGNAAVATIFAPDGKVVKDSIMVAKGDLWSNAAAYKGGFAVRVAGIIYFFDNNGTPTGNVNQNTSGDSFDAGRGDGTRIAGHINSPYVYLAGKVSTGPIVRVAAFDSRTASFVAVADVSEGGFRGDFDRATVTSDALNRIVVSWVAKPDGYENQQVAARVLALDATTKTIKPLTSSFLAFVNAAPVGGIRTLQMSLAMTTKQILIAAKGEINLANKPELGADSNKELNFYTVISHPAPAEDPTPAVGSSSTGLQISGAKLSGSNVTVTWTGGKGPFTVQKRSAVGSGTWSTVTTTSDSSAVIPADGAAGFIRIQGQ